MIFDCFLLLNELDLLELRLSELDDVVDRFVLVESAVTFRGDAKPLHFRDSTERFARWRDRIIHVVPDDLPTGDNPWAREHASRQWMLRALPDVKDDDIVMVCDVDEIPRADVVKAYSPAAGLHDMQMRQYRYHLNHLDVTEMWYYPKIGSGADFKRADDGNGGIRYHQGRQTGQVIPDAGWHFSYLGGTEAVSYKVRQFSHCHEPGARMMLSKIECGLSPVIFDGWKLRKVPIDDTFPAYVREHEAELRDKGLIS